MLLQLVLTTPAFAQQTTHYTQVVDPADPGLQWTAPAPIPAGVALGPEQLSATARTPGVFNYTPPAGTVLSPGSHSLSVFFQPDDVNFRTAEASVSLLVLGDPTRAPLELRVTGRAAQEAAVVVRPNHPASVSLVLVPVEITPRIVHLSCVPLAGVSCTFSPNPVSLRTRPEPIRLVIALNPSPGQGHSGGGYRGLGTAIKHPLHTPRLPFAALAAGVVLISCRSRRQRTAARAAIAWTCLMLAALFAEGLSGCGTDRGVETLTLVASSGQISERAELRIVLR